MNGLMHLFQRRLQRHVALDGRQVIGKIGQLFIRSKLLSLRAFNLFNMGIEIIQIVIVDEALAARELIKISVLQNCLEDPRQMAEVLAERTRSQIVQVIGKKIVLYREGKNEKKKIELPRK